MGTEKRDLLVSKIETTKEAQEVSKKEARDVLEQVRKKYGLKDREIEQFYDYLKSDFEDLEGQAQGLKNKAEDVRTIAGDLFKEWEQEAYTFKNKNYKRQSLTKLGETKKKFYALSKSMEASEKQLDQVVATLRDQVLFVKHNLNAKTLITFENEFGKIETEIEKLILKIDKSISATQDFQLSLN